MRYVNSNTNFKVRFFQEVSTPIKVQTGLRQVDKLSIMLFNKALKRITINIEESQKMNLDRVNLLLAYADDIEVLGKSKDYILRITQKLLESSKMMSLKVNQQKIKYMRIKKQR